MVSESEANDLTIAETAARPSDAGLRPLRARRTGVAPATALPADSSGLVIERLLRDRDEIWRQIKDEEGLLGLIRGMVIMSALALALYGAIMGIFGGLDQALASAIKLPLLFLLTLVICLPTLYLFNLFYGGRLTALQVLALALAAITVTAALTVAFAPISVFFLLSARDYTFFKILNVAILALTGFAGLSFLVGGMRSMNALDPTATPPAVSEVTANADAETPLLAPPPGHTPRAVRPVSMPLLQIWLLLYGFVGTQLGWTLRPFFGDPGLPFQFFRPLEGNFYVHLLQILANLLRLR